MFTQPCSINVNKYDLRIKLYILGYKMKGKLKAFPFIYCKNGYFRTPSFNEKPSKNSYIDCGTNEDLFLAIASLRDDTDRGQWFVKNDENVWLQCVDNKFVFYTCINESGSYELKDISTLYHKATVQEIIEHFSKKEEKP